MLLMPVHVLFLQIIIDPACSIVFEAEPLEEDAMRSRPRRPDARLFDWEILIRGLLQGGGLLALLVALYLWIRHAGGADDLARTTTFLALVLANLGLIYANSSWRQAAWKRSGAPNRYLVWGSLGAAALLLLVLGAPPLRALFDFAIPDPPALLAGAVAVGLSLGWFEAVKWGYAFSAARRRPPPARPLG
jgi:Ca2+-transporting ATPase